MTTTVTIDDIWQLFKKTDERLAILREETLRDQARMDSSLREAMLREHEKTEATLRDQATSLREAMSREHEKTEAALRKLSRQMGQFSNQVGEFAEEMVVPAARRLFTARGIPVHMVARNIYGERDGRATEVDIMVVNTDYVVAIEVKVKPQISHVNDHLERLTIFKEIFPEHRERKLMGAIAGIVFDANVARYAYQRGLFVMGQSGDIVTILNDGKFQPKIW